MKKYIILLLLLACILPLKAQYLNNGGAKITIDANVYVRSGEWTNTNATSETNLIGELSLTRNLVNNGAFNTAIPSTLSFVGTTVQNVQGNTPISLYDLQVNKPTGNLNLQNSVTVSNILTLTNGLLVSETVPIVFSPTALNPLETNTSRIVGTATMQTRAVGAGAFPTFLGYSLAAGADIGSLSFSRFTGTQGVTTIPPERSIASRWDINATNNVNRDITYSWLSVLDNGLDLTDVQPRLSTTGTWTAVGAMTDLSTRTYTVNNSLNGEWSLFALIPPSAPTPILPTPNAPLAFKAVTVSTTQINLSWNAVAQNVTSYRLYQNDVLIATLPLGTLSYEFKDLKPDTFYDFSLVAVNTLNSDQKISPRVSARAITFPEAPVLLSQTNICQSGSSQIQVSSSGAVYRIYADSLSDVVLLETNNATIDLPSISETTTFYVSVFSNNQESKRKAVTITVEPTFEAKIAGERSRISCENSLVLEAEPIEGATYQWFRNGVEVGTGQSYEATFSAAYQVRVSKGVCSFLSENTTIELNFSPVAKIAEQDGISFCTSGNLTASNTNSETTYQWFLDGEVIGEGTNISVTKSGTYRLQATQKSCISFTEIDVNITQVPEQPILVATSTALCPTEETTISVENVVDNVDYEWFRNGVAIRQTGNSIITSIQGNYQVGARASQNTSCTAVSNQVEIVRFETKPIYLRVSEDKKSLFVEDVNFSQTDIISVEWYFDGKANANLGTTNQITPTEDGYYYAKVINQNGCLVQTIRGVDFKVPKDEVITGEEETKEGIFNVYPNPSTGVFKVQFPAILIEDIQTSVFDATGKVIHQQTFHKGKQEFMIDIQKFSKGVYLIRFNQNKTSYSKSIILE